MSIHIDAEKRIFTLHTLHSTYQMQADRLDQLLHLYYGARTGGSMDYLLCFADRGFSGNPAGAGEDRTYSLDVLPQEFPYLGSGDFRAAALVVRGGDGAFGCGLRYRGYELLPGKYRLPGLPAVYAEDAADEAESLKIILEDERLSLRVELLYGVLPKLDVITRSVVVRNLGSASLCVEKLLSASLDFVGGDYDLISFHGRHAMERLPDRRPLGHGSSVIGSRRGYSSHQYNPFVILADRTATESAGRCWAMQFVWSGSFRAEGEKDQFGLTRLQMGLGEEQFSYPLASGESLIGPEVILSYSGAGLERLSHQLHRCLRRHVCRGKYRDSRRPVLLNSWEASYFDFDGGSLLSLAQEAAALGMEMLVMDDGWFGSRYDDRRALGDWHVNVDKLGCTLGELIERVNALGLKFGIWMEPEMINEDSELYRSHPDWALAIPGKAPIRSRSQLVLDFSRAEVREHIFESICQVLDQGRVEYLKWDVNRSIADVYSHTAADQGRVLYDNMLGVYEILERLNTRYPDLLIEGCSGGGGRFDAGMLYYSPQIWCSDNTDAIDRLRIQYGTSFGYPVSAVGSHVSACPNHQTGRTVPIETRGAVAAAGTFGCELDPAKLSEAERRAVREQTRLYRENADLIREGLYYRLSDPMSDDCCAWAFVSEDGKEAMITAVLQALHGYMQPQYIRLRGLTPGALYRDRESGRIFGADALMDMGLPLPQGMRQFESFVWRLEKC